MLFSKINSKTSIIILVIFLMGNLFFIRNSFLAIEQEMDVLALSQVITASGRLRGPAPKIKYIINFGEDNNIIEDQMLLLKDSTVFSLLNGFAEKNYFKIETTYYDEMGILVDSIDRIENGINDKYWQYWVNDELPIVAADKMKVNQGDTIEWRFEAISF